MKLKDMQITKAERKEREESCKVPMPYEGDKYPYGLRISLDEAALKKLGLTTLPKVGANMTMEANVEIVGTSQNDRTGGKTDRRLEFQITSLGLESRSPKSALDAIDDGIEEADND